MSQPPNPRKVEIERLLAAENNLSVPEFRALHPGQTPQQIFRERHFKIRSGAPDTIIACDRKNCCIKNGYKPNVKILLEGD